MADETNKRNEELKVGVDKTNDELNASLDSVMLKLGTRNKFLEDEYEIISAKFEHATIEIQNQKEEMINYSKTK